MATVLAQQLHYCERNIVYVCECASSMKSRKHFIWPMERRNCLQRDRKVPFRNIIFICFFFQLFLIANVRALHCTECKTIPCILFPFRFCTILVNWTPPENIAAVRPLLLLGSSLIKKQQQQQQYHQRKQQHKRGKETERKEEEEKKINWNAPRTRNKLNSQSNENVAHSNSYCFCLRFFLMFYFLLRVLLGDRRKNIATAATHNLHFTSCFITCAAQWASQWDRRYSFVWHLTRARAHSHTLLGQSWVWYGGVWDVGDLFFLARQERNK